MFLVSVHVCLLLTAATQPKLKPSPGMPKTLEDTLKPAYTAFPDLKPPMKELPGGGGLLTLDFAKLHERVNKKFPLAIPADATPLHKVQLIQANEGAVYWSKTLEVFTVGKYDPESFRTAFANGADVFLAAAEMEMTLAARIPWYEERIIFMKVVEEFEMIRLAANNEPPQSVHLARFHRLQAEADLLKLKAEIEKAGKK